MNKDESNASVYDSSLNTLIVKEEKLTPIEFKYAEFGLIERLIEGYCVECEYQEVKSASSNMSNLFSFLKPLP